MLVLGFIFKLGLHGRNWSVLIESRTRFQRMSKVGLLVTRFVNCKCYPQAKPCAPFILLLKSTLTQHYHGTHTRTKAIAHPI